MQCKDCKFFYNNFPLVIMNTGTMQIVNKTEFSELTTMVPKLEEQKKIGQYFHTIGHLITLHQRMQKNSKQYIITMKSILNNIKY